MLNGRPYLLRLVLDQGYWPDTILAAPNDDALRYDVELVKQMGFNGVRKHQKIEDPRYLYWADKLGLLVWEEMPSAYRSREPRSNAPCASGPKRSNATTATRASSSGCHSTNHGACRTCLRHRSNGMRSKLLYHLTKTLDATRPVIGNDGGRVAPQISSAFTITTPTSNIFASATAPKFRSSSSSTAASSRGRILTLDGLSSSRPTHCAYGVWRHCLRSRCRRARSQKAWGYSMCRRCEKFARRVSRALGCGGAAWPLFSGFCYTQFSDTFQEANGLLCADRDAKNSAPADQREATQTFAQPILHDGV